MNFTYRPHNACLGWTADGQPFAEERGSVYPARSATLDERRHIFLDGNDLTCRFRSLQQADFIIGEPGFGAGLNFLNTCRLWCEQAPPTSTLHYVASEAHPWSKSDLERLLRDFPTLTPWATGLLSLYPDHTSGTQQLALRFGEHRVCLTLLLEEAAAAFKQLAAAAPFTVDVWYLDDFFPGTQPAPWPQDLLQQLATLSQGDTTLATYPVAESFRRRLEQVGFACEKVAGSSGTPHMLRARCNGTPLLRQSADRQHDDNNTVCIIGGGLAGCSTAHALANAGWQVFLIEQGPGLASGASGNPQGILHFKPGTVDTTDNRFNLQAYLYATRRYRSLSLPAEIWSPCGMLQLAHDDKLLKRFETLARSGLYAPEVLQVLDSSAASNRSAQAVSRPALYFPEAGWLSPARLCTWYTTHPRIQVLRAHCVTQLSKSADGWLVLMHGEHGERFQFARHVVLCNSSDAWRFSQARHLPLICNRGQVDVYAGDAAPELDTVICGQGYLVPPGADGQAVGGSFFLGPDTAAMREKNRRQHLQQLSGIHSDLAEHYSAQQPVSQRIAERCTLPGRLPVVGALEAGANSGLWINVGHGSHGLARTPICAALLASQLGATPAPLSPELVPLLSPLRFPP